MADEWLAADKVGHLTACCLVTLLVWRLQSAATPRRRRLVRAAAVGFAVGVAKEVIDGAEVRLTRLGVGECLEELTEGSAVQLWPTGGAFSVRDLVADAAGCAAACGFVVLAVSPPTKADSRDAADAHV